MSFTRSTYNTFTLETLERLLALNMQTAHGMITDEEPLEEWDEETTASRIEESRQEAGRLQYFIAIKKRELEGRYLY